MSTKAELKENILASKLETTISWLVNNRSTALTIAGVAVGVFLISSVFVIRRKEIATTNLTRLSQAQSFLGQRQYEQANQILSELANNAHNGEFVTTVAYHQGLSALGTGEFDKAATFFQKVIDQSGSSPLKPLALNNLAFSFEQMKKYDLASASYGRFMTDFGNHFLAPRVQLALGRSLLLSGKNEESTKALQQLIDLYPTSPWAENARSFLDKNKSR